MSVNYPFAAIVGQDALREALVWLAIDPGIGGILVTGTRGTAKSTAVRALVDLLPPIAVEDQPRPTPFVELPVGATEDRVIGTLDVRRLLTDAEQRFEPGLLARADRGVLYVDEVNLLPDHLVDVLLDAAATGRNVIERDGISFEHEARIMLVGTMNPEEGELRPQLLDRFGLCVGVVNDDDLERRVAIVERRIAFDRDPAAFVAAYAADARTLRARIARARESVAQVTIERERYREAARLAVEARVEGMRADLTIVRAARAIAAFDGRTAVVPDDIERAAEPALAHRRREAPRGTPPPSPPRRTPPPRSDPAPNEPTAPTPPNGTAGANAVATFDVGAASEVTLDDAPAVPTAPPQHAGGRGRPTVPRPGGRAFVSPDASGTLAVFPTIRSAARERSADDATLAFAPRHVRFVQRRGPQRRLVVFAIDASGSMAAAARMRAAKGVVCGLLEAAYQRRDLVALIAFRDETAEVLVPPTRSAALAYRRLAHLPTGGRTPLAAGLRRAHETLAAYARREPATRAHLVVVSDGRANVPALGAVQAALDEATAIRATGARVLCIDTEAGRIRLGDTRRLAGALDASYRRLDDCTERALGAAVREWMAVG